MTRLLHCFSSLFLCLIFVAVPSIAAAPDFGFLWICTVKAAARTGEEQHLASRVIVAVYPSSSKNSSVKSYTITDETGYALVPLRPGRYCAEAYDTTGRKLRLDKATNYGRPICFDISAHKISEAGITISYGEEYKSDIPSKGID